jgi:hypothetical protein
LNLHPKTATSSRWFAQEDSISFFWPRTNATILCLWLGWDDRWVAWYLKSGKLFEPSSSQTSEWNAEGRRRSRNLIHSGTADAPHYNFLGRLQITEDRPLIENWLADFNFSTGSRQTSISSGLETGSEKQEIRSPSPGDYISTNASLIHVRKGEVTLAPDIECKTPVQ